MVIGVTGDRGAEGYDVHFQIVCSELRSRAWPQNTIDPRYDPKEYRIYLIYHHTSGLSTGMMTGLRFAFAQMATTVELQVNQCMLRVEPP